MRGERTRPGLKSQFKQPLHGELKNIWYYLSRISIGPEWRFYPHDDGLYLQKYDPAAKYYKSKMLIDSSGNLKITGTLASSQTLDDVGRS